MRRAVAPALPDLHPACGLAGIARPFVGSQGCGVAGPTPRGHRAAQNDPQTAPGLGRPGSPFRAHTAAGRAPARIPADHARHSHALAPPPGRQKVDLPAPIRTSTHQRDARRADRADGHGERDLGTSTNPGRTPQTRPSRWCFDDPQDPQATADTADAMPKHRHDLAAVSAHPGLDHTGSRFRAAKFTFLIRDRAGQFTASFDTVLADTGIRVVKIRTGCPERTASPRGSCLPLEPNSPIAC